MGKDKDSPLKSRKKYVTTRSNKFFEEESSIDNCTTETFYTGGSSKGKQFFFPTFNITDEKFGVKHPIMSQSNSRLNTPEKQDEVLRSTNTKSRSSLTLAKSLEQVTGTTYKNSPVIRNSTNIRLVEIKDD